MRLQDMTKDELEALLIELELKEGGEGTKDIYFRHKVEEEINSRLETQSE